MTEKIVYAEGKRFYITEAIAPLTVVYYLHDLHNDDPIMWYESTYTPLKKVCDLLNELWEMV